MSCYPERRKGRLTGVWIAEAVLHSGERPIRRRFATKKEGEQWADIVKLTGIVPANGDKPAPNVITLKRVADECKAAGGPGGHWKRRRDKQVIQRIDYVVDFLGPETPIEDVTTAALDRLVANLAKRPSGPRGGPGGHLAAGTINRYVAFASALLVFAVDRGYLKAAPKVPWQKESGRRILWLSYDDEAAVCAALEARGQHDEALVVRALCATGMRWGELASLEPSQVEDDWIRLWTTKTDRARSIPITQSLARQLRELVARKGMPAHSTMGNRFKRAVISAGRNAGLCLHSCRHTTASRLVQAGVNLKIVKEFLGHSSLNTTLKYAHLNEEALAEAAKKLTPHAGQMADAAAFRVITNLEKSTA
jgi:integrase